MYKELLDIKEKFAQASLGYTLHLLESVARAMFMDGELLELASISDNYRRMQSYVAQDADDNKRGELYDDLRYRAYVVLARLLASTIAKNNPTFGRAQALSQKNPVDYAEIEDKLNWFYSEIAISKLSPSSAKEAAASLIRRLYDYRRRLFDSVYTTLALSASEAEGLRKYLLSPTADYTDLRLVVSALLLAQNTLFDVRKFRLLVNVYTSSPDPDIRQIALVALAMTDQKETHKDSYPYYELHAAIFDLLKSEHIKEDVAQLQMQVLLCRRTEQTSRTISDEILPTLHESAAGLRPDADKTENELLDELLHPGKADNLAEKMEESLNRMREMQQSGADVFFSGFSHAKRFPFFHTLMNWFVPFSVDHPQIQYLPVGDFSVETIEKMLKAQPFCDSDKYSFYITLSTVINRIPAEMIDILKKGEIPQDTVLTLDTACRRRLYLQDLYRFFNLYTSKSDFRNPFSDEESALFVCGDIFQAILHDIEDILPIAKFLLKHGEYTMLERLLTCFQEPGNPAYMKLKALMHSGLQQWTESLKWYKKALEKEPDNYALVHKTALTAMKGKEYELAVRLFEKLSLAEDDDILSPDDEYYYAFCLMRTLNNGKALQILYKLTFLHEDNCKYKLLLAVAYVGDRNYKDAQNTLSSVDDDSLKTDSERLLKSLLLWCVGARTEAFNVIKRVVEKTNASYQTLSKQITLMAAQYNLPISKQDEFILTDLAFDNNYLKQ